MKKSLPMIYNQNTKILIVGTAPGETSLEKKQYYSNKSNRFWKTIFNYLKIKVPIDYDERIDILTANNIGLWDTYESFKRTKGSQDSNIEETVMNDFLNLPKSIKLIISNGNEPYKRLRKIISSTDKLIIPCYSTSSTHRNISQTEIESEWKKALDLGKLL